MYSSFLIKVYFPPPQEKLFNQLLTERVCPLVVKLFSPTSKYRHSSPTPTNSPTSAMLYADKPTFALSVRLLRILNVLIREFYSCLVRVTFDLNMCAYRLALIQRWSAYMVEPVYSGHPWDTISWLLYRGGLLIQWSLYIVVTLGTQSVGCYTEVACLYSGACI